MRGVARPRLGRILLSALIVVAAVTLAPAPTAPPLIVARGAPAVSTTFTAATRGRGDPRRDGVGVGRLVGNRRLGVRRRFPLGGRSLPERHRHDVVETGGAQRRSGIALGWHPHVERDVADRSRALDASPLVVLGPPPSITATLCAEFPATFSTDHALAAQWIEHRFLNRVLAGFERSPGDGLRPPATRDT
jgi:hypothetical protein